MRELAFGKQDVNFSKGTDNSKVQRQSDIEKGAINLYIFFADKFGEENIVIFVVHLDDATPHAHCQILPITKENKFSYRKIMVGEINSKNAYRDKKKNINKVKIDAMTSVRMIIGNLTFKELNSICT